MRLALVLAVLLVAQQPDPPPRHDKYRDDPHAYCLAGKPLDTHGHECACKLLCDEATPAQPIREDPGCEMYCSKARCVCHVDQGCEGPPA